MDGVGVLFVLFFSFSLFLSSFHNWLTGWLVYD